METITIAPSASTVQFNQKLLIQMRVIPTDTHDPNLPHVIDSTTQHTTDEDEEIAYLGNEWQWNQWEHHNIDDEIEGPKEDDRYEGPHGLKLSIGKRLYTVLQCLFETTAMDRVFFVRLCGESNKYARKVMKDLKTILFLGHKWNNISVEEMVHFFGILLRISL